MKTTRWMLTDTHTCSAMTFSADEAILLIRLFSRSLWNITNQIRLLDLVYGNSVL